MSARRGSFRKSLKWATIIVAALVIAPLLLLALALLFLQTDLGGRVARGQIVSWANETLRGTLEIGSLDFRGAQIHLTDVVLRDPEGEVAAKVDALELDLGVRALFRRTVHVELLRIDHPELHLVQGEEGTNLQRALEPREPTPSEKLPVDVILDALTVEHGRITYEASAGPRESTVSLTDLKVDAALSVRNGGEVLNGRIDANGALEEPQQGPLKLHATVRGEEGHRDVNVDFSAAGSELRGSARIEGDGADHLDAHVERLVLPPPLVRAFVPAYPLVATVRGTATASRRGSAINGEGRLSAGSGAIDARGDFDLETFRSSGITLQMREVDLSELLVKGPRSDLGMTIQMQGGGRSLETAEGTLRVEAPPSRIGGSTFGPIHIEADAKNALVALRRLDARLPGLALTASGEVSEERLAIDGRLVAKDLTLLGDTLGRLSGPEGIPIRGSGQLSFAVTGSTRSPGVSASGGFPFFAYGQNSVRDLQLRLEVPDLRRPLDRDGRVDVKARSATLSQRRIDSPALVMTVAQGAVAAEVKTRGFIDAFLSVRGQADEDRNGLVLRSIELRYPEARWTLEREAHLRFDPEHLVVDGLSLRSNDQRIAVDLEKISERLRASIDLHAIDLSRFPKALVDPALQLRGTLSANARASGRSDAPHVTAQLTLEGGQYREYRDLNMSLDASWADQRARGKVQASGVGVRLDGQFDVPVLALRTGSPSPVRADLIVEDFALEQVGRAIGKELPVRGRAGATLRLRGNARDPQLRAELHGREIVYQEQAPLDLDAVVKTDERGRLRARLDATSQGQPGFAALDTPWTLGGLIRKPPTAEQALAVPIALAARFEGFPLPASSGQPTLDADVDLRGSPLSLRGRGEIAVKGLASGDFQNLDVLTQIRLDAREMLIDATVQQQQSTLARAHAVVEGTLAKLRDPRRLSGTRWSLDAEWGPIGVTDLQRLGKQQPPPPGQDAAPTLTGITRGKLTAHGTLEDPTVVLDATVHGLGSAQTAAVGDVSIRYRYGQAVSVLEADLLSGRDGTMTLRGRVPLELSWSRVKEGLAWERAPVSLKLEARAFDPAFLSGVSPKVLRIRGRMDSSVQVAGTAALPRIEGQFEWKDGRLVLAGSGSYEKIHLLVRGTQEGITLEELTASAGEGTARLTGQAVREADDRLRLALSARTKEFPLTSQDQLAATLSIEADAKGTASTALVDADLAIKEAHVRLPPSGRKDVQTLQNPPDVVFLRNGKPLEKPKQAMGGAGTAGGPPQHQIRVRVHAPRNLWVVSDDLNVELGLAEGFRMIQEDQPHVFGEVKIIRGRLDVFGRRFDFQRDSTVSFAGPPQKPQVDLVALHNNEREQVKVTLRVTGTAQNLKMSTTSDPPLSETEIYTLLATGRRSLRPGTTASGSSNPAVSVLGSIAAAQLKRGIEQVLPLDVLSIEPGERGIAGTRVEAGTYIGDRLYLGIESRIGGQRERNENQNQLNAEYQLWRRWMLELEYGDARQGNADLMWRKQY